jgi:hypothetical protein
VLLPGFLVRVAKAGGVDCARLLRGTLRRLERRGEQKNKSVLVLFFKKEQLPYWRSPRRAGFSVPRPPDVGVVG